MSAKGQQCYDIDEKIIKKHTTDPNATISDTMKEFNISENKIIKLLIKAANRGEIVHF